MPIYEYECSLCHAEFECRQGFNDEAVSTCPKCGGKAKRVLRSVPVIFKGSGFYVTDTRKELAPQKETKSLAAPKTEKVEKLAAKSEDKKAAKSEDKTAAK